MRVTVRNPTGTEVTYNATSAEIRNLISGWAVRPGFEVETYEHDGQILIIIKKVGNDK